MVALELFEKVLVSLAVGGLIGIEREKSKKGEVIAGFRTFMLVSLFGTAIAYLESIFLLVAGIISLAIYAGLGILKAEKGKGEKVVGITTEVALLISFLAGYLIYRGPMVFGVGLGIITAILLVAKEEMHSFAYSLKEYELEDAIKFALFAFVILPILPNRTIGPFGFFNPFKFWLMVVLVLGIDFSGYIAMKLLGAKKGVGLTGLFGGLVSSTALTSSMSTEVNENKSLLGPATFAIIVACSIMFFRTIVETAVINTALAVRLLIPQLILGGAGFLISLYFMREKGKKKMKELELGSPLSLKSALKFGIIFILILGGSNLASRYLGESGTYLAALVSGLADVDAITVSMASLAGEGVTHSTAVKAIILASVSNTITKGAIAGVLGTKQLGKKIGLSFAILVVIGLIIFFSV